MIVDSKVDFGTNETLAIVRAPATVLASGERTFIEREPIQFETALRQHSNYADALSGLGLRLLHLPSMEAFPDSVFVEDTAIILDEFAILAQMGTFSRRPEVDGIAPILKKYREVMHLESPASLEGGDVIVSGKTILIGVSRRSNVIGARQVEQLTKSLGYKVTPVSVHGCLHLKTACTRLPDGRLLLNPRWIDSSALAEFRTLEIPEEEPWAACQLSVGNRCVIDDRYLATVELLSREKYHVQPIPLSELAKAEAGPTCLSLIFNKW